ncbi:MAG: enoyl-CoA hydratase/isomerase family protein [Candidatus Hydrogenedentes bacterium]|nr:enoyl-CoA hydratase/isomerase family protein [Candidatus Hydrogenedentota bacterium]
MSNSPVLTEHPKTGIVVLTLNRPERRNALSIPVMEAFCDALDTANADESQRIIIITGAGPVFCAGLDLKESQQRDLAHTSAELVARTLKTISESRAVTIAAVHGAAIAGGAGIMSACDLVIASEDTKIGYPEVRRGLVAGLVMTFMRRQMRERDARELLVLGELVTAHRALEMGLVNRVVPAGTHVEQASILAKAVLKGAPGAIAHSKAMLREMWPRPVDADLAYALEHHKLARASQEAVEGIAAFNQKRLPNWDPESERA